MKNLLNIDDQVKIVMPGVIGNGEIVKVTQIDIFGGELYYMGTYHYNCPDGGEGYDTAIQFREGQYEPVNVSAEISKIAPISSSKVRCKFRCHYKEEQKNANTGEVLSATIKMSPVYSEFGENKEFWKYTPAGDLSFYIVNPLAAAQIEQGKEYYIDISPSQN